MVARCFQQSNGICVKTIVGESGDVYVQVANNKRKNPRVIYNTYETDLFNRCILDKIPAFKG